VSNVLLSIQNLKTHFFTFRGIVEAVDNVEFSVNEGDSLGLVGESGSGKTVTGLSILKLIQPPGKIVSGDIRYKGQSLIRKTEGQMQKIRGAKISMIFQNPRTCLNPVLTIGEQIDRVYSQHRKSSNSEAKKRRLEMLERVRIGDPEGISKSYPHQLSGGMCQRVMIVMAIICEPELLIADEPTTGLDVTIQRQIMELLGEMRKQLNATQIFITHDLGVVAETCNRVVVMYSGRVVETAPTDLLFTHPGHPYTRGLLASIPRIDSDKEPMILKGNVPNPANKPKGCPFHPRCKDVQDVCRQEIPPNVKLGMDHTVSCHLVSAQS
jgi:oligopeptide/dipeptide ABC transporter ATP-binding protein